MSKGTYESVARLLQLTRVFFTTRLIKPETDDADYVEGDNTQVL